MKPSKGESVRGRLHCSRSEVLCLTCKVPTGWQTAGCTSAFCTVPLDVYYINAPSASLGAGYQTHSLRVPCPKEQLTGAGLSSKLFISPLFLIPLKVT